MEPGEECDDTHAPQVAENSRPADTEVSAGLLRSISGRWGPEGQSVQSYPAQGVIRRRYRPFSDRRIPSFFSLFHSVERPLRSMKR